MTPSYHSYPNGPFSTTGTQGRNKKQPTLEETLEAMPAAQEREPSLLRELKLVFAPKRTVRLGGSAYGQGRSAIKERAMLWGGTMLLMAATLGSPLLSTNPLLANNDTPPEVKRPQNRKEAASPKRSGKKAAARPIRLSLTEYGQNLAEVRGKFDSLLQRKLDTLPQDRFVRGWSFVILKLDKTGLTPERKELLGLTYPRGYIYRRLPLINSVAVAVPTRSLIKVATYPFVLRVSADAPMKKSDEFSVGGSGSDLAAAQYGVNGSGVTVAVLDTGIDRHEDFRGRGRSRILADVNFVPKKNGKPSPQTDDDCGHGTHIAGIVAGDGSASTGPRFTRTFTGIAPGAALVNIRVLDDEGLGNVSDVIAGVDWAIQNRFRYNIRVLNISSGHEVGESYTTDPLCQAVTRAWENGIVVVCAAGNGGRAHLNSRSRRDNEGYGTAYGSIQSPANTPSVITVGAMKRGSNQVNAPRSAARIATYSSRGPSRLDFVLKPDLVAPGDGIISTLARHSYLEDAFDGQNQVSQAEYIRNGSDRPSRDYLRLSGTSMAAPVVSGAVALLLERNPGMTPDMVKARLMLTADKWSFPTGKGDACTFGAGYLNISAALADNTFASVPALSPTLSLNADGTVTVNDSHLMVPVAGGLSPFGTGLVGGSQAIWGGNAVAGRGQFHQVQGLSSSLVWTDSQVYSIANTRVDLSSVAILGDR